LARRKHGCALSRARNLDPIRGQAEFRRDPHNLAVTIHKDLLLIFIAAGEAHPDASRRQKLELALHRLITKMIQERIAPLDGRAAQQAALWAAQRKTQGRLEICATP